MKRYISVSMVILIVASWLIFQKSINTRQVNYEKQVNMGDEYAAMGAYIDAMKSYDNAIKYADDNSDKLYVKKFNIYMKEEKLNEAKNTLSIIYKQGGEVDKQGGEVEKLAGEYLKKSIENKDYERVNAFIEEFRNLEASKKYQDEMKFILEENKSIYSKVIQEGKSYSLVEVNGNYRLINSKDRTIFNKKEGEIRGFDEEKSLITFSENGKNFLLDFENNTRSILKRGEIKPFNGGRYVLIEPTRQTLLDQLNSPLIEANKIGTFSSGKTYILQDRKLRIVDQKLNTIREFEAEDVKENPIGQGVVDNKIILISDDGVRKKEKICSIETGKCSKYYDEIDFSRNSFIAVKENGKWGFIGQDFREVASPIYGYARSFSDDIGIVKTREDLYLIDKALKTKKMPLYLDILGFNEEGIGFAKSHIGWKQVKLAKRIKK